MKPIKMKQMVMAVIFTILTGLVACNNDTTELAFRNSTSSTGDINTIIWADDDAVWEREGGWAKNEETESKSISVLDGEVDALVLDGSDFVEADVDLQGSEASGQKLSLDEGVSYVFEITVSPATP